MLATRGCSAEPPSGAAFHPKIPRGAAGTERRPDGRRATGSVSGCATQHPPYPVKVQSLVDMLEPVFLPPVPPAAAGGEQPNGYLGRARQR